MAIRPGIVGRLAGPEADPSAVISTPGAQRVLSALARSPGRARRAADLHDQEAAGALKDLISLGIITEDSPGQFRLAWPLWKEEDGRLLEESSGDIVSSLAAEIGVRWSLISSHLDAMSSTRLSGRGRAACFVLGCMALDWGVIYGLAARGLLSLGRNFENGSEYLLNLYQEDYQPDAGYCSSHNRRVGQYFFTTFGSDAGYRLGLPDLMPSSGGWSESEHPTFTRYRERYQELARELDDEPTALAGDLLEDLVRTGRPARPSPLSQFLRDTGYLDDALRPRLPVILESDADSVSACVKTVVEAVIPTVPDIKRALAGLSPVVAGLSWELCLMEIWHFLFGRLNQLLAQQGLFEVDEPQYPGQGIYISAVTAGYEAVESALMQAVLPRGRDEHRRAAPQGCPEP